MRIRVLALVLAAVVALTAVPPSTGCGGGDGGGTSQVIASPISASDTPTPTPTPAPTQSAPSDLQMTSIPGGTFQMSGRSVALSSFYASKYEVTYAQWVEVRNWAEAHGYTFNMPGDMGSEDYGGTQDESHPVTDMEWYDAVLWCNALSEMEGRTPCYYTSSAKSTVYRLGRVDIQNDWVRWDANGYRLPTEAEWEYACRAGTTTDYSFGDAIHGSNANYWDSGDSYDNGTTPVGSYPANAWGLYDLHGNVWEWCWDWYGSYGSSPANDPRGPSAGSLRVLRGGSWSIVAEVLRSAYRFNAYPDFDYCNIGFRPVRSHLTGMAETC